MTDLYVLQYCTGEYCKWVNTNSLEFVTTKSLEEAGTFFLNEIVTIYKRLPRQCDWSVYKVATKRISLGKFDPDKLLQEIQDLENQIKDLTKQLKEKKAALGL